MIEEALLGALERRTRSRFGLRVQGAGRAGDVRCLHRRVEIVMDDREGAGIGVVNADLLVGEFMFDQLVFDAIIGQRTRRIEAECLEVARQHFHRRDAAGFDRLDEFSACRERKVLAAPQPEALGIGQIVNRGRTGRRDVDDARIRQRMLQAKPGPALLRGGHVATFTFPARGILHRVRLVEDNHAVEIGAQPFHDLLDPRYLLVACVGP